MADLLDPQDLQLLRQLDRDNVHDGARPVVSSGEEIKQAFRLSDQGLIALEQLACGVRLHITRKGVAVMTPPQSTGFAAPTDESVAGLVERLRERWESTDAPVAKKVDRLLAVCREAATALPDAHERGMDAGVDFLFDELSGLLGVPDCPRDAATETWDGDVRSVLHRILTMSGVIDEDTGALATARAEASEARATALEGERDELRTKVEHLAKQEVDIRASYCLVRADNAELARENKRLDREWEAAEVGAKEARAALKPFADLGVGSGPDDEADNQPYRILRGAIRRARSILEG